MTHSTAERKFILVFRLLMAWTFLYAASHQAVQPKLSAAGSCGKQKHFTMSMLCSQRKPWIQF
jgi:hypothetical protein